MVSAYRAYALIAREGNRSFPAKNGEGVSASLSVSHPIRQGWVSGSAVTGTTVIVFGTVKGRVTT